MKNRSFRILLCLTLAWLCFIFGHSLMPATVSDGESRGIFAWLSQYLPWLTHHLLRKLAHFSAFTILGCLFTATLWQTKHFFPFRPMILALLAAFADETIQLFVPGRSGQVSDMWIDLSGAVFGTVSLWLILRRKNRMTE